MTKPHHNKLARRLRQIREAIDRRGYCWTGVLDDQHSSGFSYTTGWFIRGHPELMTFGLDAEESDHLFFHIAEDLRAGIVHPVDRGQPFELCGANVCLLHVPTEHWVGRRCLLLGIDRYYEAHPS